MTAADDEGLVARAQAAARTLQHDLRANDPAVARAAAVRFTQLPEFAAVPLADLIGGAVVVLRRHAQQLVALEHGYVSWLALLEAALPTLHGLPMHSDRMAPYLNRWFTDYAEASASRQADGGVLLPYRTQFFVTPRPAVAELGLDPHDPDWDRIGDDWVLPKDPDAHLRLCRARLRAIAERGEEFGRGR